jgi:hypothetical protein
MNRPVSKRRGPEGQHQRSWERVKHICLAWIEGESGEAIEGLARTLDLSPAGAGLVLSRELPVGTRVAVELLLPGSLRLKASGEVVHTLPLEGGQFRIGVRFFSAPVLADAAPKKET